MFVSLLTGSKVRLYAIAAVSAFLLLLPMTASAVPQGQSLNLQMGGIITNAGSQQYSLSGGQFVSGSLYSTPLPSKTSVQYSLSASITGLRVTGEASLQVSTPGYGGNPQLEASIAITGIVPAAIFPLTSTGGNCNPSAGSCNSEIPLMFTGVATISTNQNVHGHSQSSTTKIPVAIESAYWNPFGGPILIVSLDSSTSPSIYLIVNYSRATINWSGVQLQGVFGGTLGKAAVQGTYQTTSYSVENLVAGNELDTGTISLATSTGPLPSVSGPFVGRTTIPTAGSFDCSTLLGLPEGTCTATGATSTGSFLLGGSHGTAVVGSYNTEWSVPSLTTSTTVSASEN